MCVNYISKRQFGRNTREDIKTVEWKKSKQKENKTKAEEVTEE